MKKILLIISIFYICFSNNTYAETWSTLENKSINEIKEDINQLHIDRNNIKNELTVLTQDNNFISYLVNNDYFREEINREDLQNIELLVKNYNKSYSDTNKQLLDKSKNLEDISDEKKYLLEIKKDLYQDLIPYIKQSQFNQYLIFIKSDASILKRESDVKYQLIQNKEVLTTKVTKIEKRIQEERKLMSEKLKTLVAKKIDEKINTIKTNEKYLSLTPELQSRVIMKTIEKVNLRIEKTKQLNTQDVILDQKIEVYQLLHDKLMNYYNTLNIKEQWE